MVIVYEDDARFTAADADALVVAACACPSCLRLPIVFLAAAAGGPTAECVCAMCRFAWRLHLDDDQAARLGARPPAELTILPCRPPLNADVLVRIGRGRRWWLRRARARAAQHLAAAWVDWLAGAAVPFLLAAPELYAVATVSHEPEEGPA